MSKIDIICSSLFRLLRLAIGTENFPEEQDVPIVPKNIWNDILDVASMHGLAGLFCAFLEQLSNEQRPDFDTYIQFVGIGVKLGSSNKMQNNEVVRISRKLTEDGVKHCVLKGQGVAALYPEPQYRQTGDIDIWIDGSRKEIIDYLEQEGEKVHVCYLHTDWPSQQKKTSVEIHFMPSYMVSPFKNRTLRKWFESQKEKQMSHFVSLPDQSTQIPFPDYEFNRFYMLHHTFRHFISEGVSLKQVVDYAVLLNHQDESSSQSFLNDKCQAKSKEFDIMTSKLGMRRFAEGMMWIMHNCLGISEDRLPCCQDEQEGRFILGEILNQTESYIQSNRTKLSRFMAKFKRHLHFLTRYPSEALWYVPFMVWETIYVRILHK